MYNISLARFKVIFSAFTSTRRLERQNGNRSKKFGVKAALEQDYPTLNRLAGSCGAVFQCDLLLARSYSEFTLSVKKHSLLLQYI